jgi:hypothetical protein
LSTNFTVFREFTIKRHNTVGGVYNRAFGSIRLTTVIGLAGQFNPVGTGIA